MDLAVLVAARLVVVEGADQAVLPEQQPSRIQVQVAVDCMAVAAVAVTTATPAAAVAVWDTKTIYQLRLDHLIQSPLALEAHRLERQPEKALMAQFA